MDTPVSKNKLLLAAALALLVTLFIFVRGISNRDTVVVFCDVGQGDGAYMRINNRIDVLIDSGPDRKILSCLGRYMPFYDRTIELVLLSHPQQDHFGGLLHVVDRYKILHFIASPVGNPANTFQELVTKLRQRGVSIESLFRGDSVNIADARLSFMWPEKEYVSQNTNSETLAIATRGAGSGPQNSYFRGTVLDLNNFSQVFVFSQRDKSILFSGDIFTDIFEGTSQQAIPHVDILKIPHHGSKNGLTSNFLKLADPGVAVISVGKHNSYGHPTNQILDLLKAADVQIRRTDTEGDIVYRIKNPN